MSQIAFLFPGEGSQYSGMFADLAPCFEEVQHWLDFWRGLYPAGEGAGYAGGTVLIAKYDALAAPLPEAVTL